MALLRVILSLLFYTVAIVSGLAMRLCGRIGNDAIDFGDYVNGETNSDEVHVRNIVESWKRDNDSME